jgi:hypothetical protein
MPWIEINTNEDYIISITEMSKVKHSITITKKGTTQIRLLLTIKHIQIVSDNDLFLFEYTNNTINLQLVHMKLSNAKASRKISDNGITKLDSILSIINELIIISKTE